LPSPLYYIENTSGQIWRIDVDGANPLQITHEPAPVLAFDISPVDGQLVYVSGNKLMAADALGGTPRVIVTGPTVPLENQHYVYRQYGPSLTIAAPRFSPDGQQIAFGLGGVNLISTAQPAAPMMLLPSDPYTPTGSLMMMGGFALPYAWSPDGARLLVQVYGYWEGTWWVMIDASASGAAPTQLNACCHPVWSAQGEAIYWSEAFGVAAPPGLQRYDVASGVLSPVVELVAVAFPDVRQDGLLAFASSGSLTTGGFDRLAMHRIDLQSGDAQLIPLRQDDYSLWEAIWAEDGSGAAIVRRDENAAVPPFTGLLLWLPAGDGPAVNLHADGWQLRWG
jgi:hypothetical protein